MAAVPKFTFDDFQRCCQECLSRAPSCAGWALSFRSEDFEREWYVTARLGTFEAIIHVTSATAMASNVPFVIAELGKVLEELRTGAADAAWRRTEILAELVAPR